MATETSEKRRWTTRSMVITAAAVVLLAGAAVTVAVLAQQDGARPAVSPSSSPSDRPATSPKPSDAAGDPSATPPVDPSIPADPVVIDQPADISPGLTAAITGLESVAGEAKRPGEVAGPAVRVTVQITNSTSAPVSLLTTVVTAYYGADQTPALELGSPGASPMPTEVAAGAAATGVYVFTVPSDERGNVRVMVDYSVDVQPLVFQGAAPA